MSAGRRRLLEIVDRFDHQGVVVHGDLVLDEFVHGQIARVSREAPVLILEYRTTVSAPGGAANAAANIRALGGRAAVVGRVGSDEPGRRLLRLLRKAGVDCTGVAADRTYVTPLKSRILAGSAHTARQQIVRIDRGPSIGPSGAAPEPGPAVRRALERALAASRRRARALLVADYGYGAVAPRSAALRAWMKDRARIVSLDSRFRATSFSGVTAAVPNIAEVESALGIRIPDDDRGAIERAGEALRKRLRARALVITRGARGMSLIEARRPATHIPVYGTDQVADVTGAGDTVAAALTLALAAGAAPLEATILANMAGGIAVTKAGTATVSRAELAAAVEAGL